LLQPLSRFAIIEVGTMRLNWKSENMRATQNPIFFTVLSILLHFGNPIIMYAADRGIAIPFFYGDAQSVYDFYFSKYPLNTAAREQIMTELKMIVNAIALEKANGNDITATLLLSTQIAQQKISTETIRNEIKNLNDFIQPYETVELDKIKRQATGPNIFRPDGYNGNCASFVRYIQSQLSLVGTYALPYYIPNSTLQILDIRENRFLKVEVDKPEKKTDSSAHGDHERAGMLKRLEQFRWQRADIVLGHRTVDATHFSIQGYWNHAGIYNSECACIIDVWNSDASDFSNGVRRSSFEFWAKYFSDIAVLRLNDIPDTTKQAIECHAAKKVGDPYSFSTHKMNPAGGWYCSKLVYHVYLQEGIDLDLGGGVIVLPDDIAISQGLDGLQCLSETIALP
jgi:uncharacterized protein YycO